MVSNSNKYEKQIRQAGKVVIGVKGVEHIITMGYRMYKRSERGQCCSSFQFEDFAVSRLL